MVFKNIKMLEINIVLFSFIIFFTSSVSIAQTLAGRQSDAGHYVLRLAAFGHKSQMLVSAEQS